MIIVHKKNLFRFAGSCSSDLLNGINFFLAPSWIELIQKGVFVVGNDRLSANLIQHFSQIPVILLRESTSIEMLLSNVRRIDIKQSVGPVVCSDDFSKVVAIDHYPPHSLG